MKPLAGLTVVDFSKVLAGPLCTQYLGDMGADIVKVEAVKDGDDTRRWPPFRGDDGTVFLSCNRNKRSIALDLKSSAGREVARRLVQGADIVVESFGPGVPQRLGIDYETLSALNPALIYCSISGFGRSGPMRDGKGYDVILQAFSGMMSITGEPDGAPSRSPFSPVDQATGFHAITGILAALLERGKTGKGALIEVSLFDTAMAFLGYFFQSYWEKGTQPAKSGSGHESLCPYQAFQAADRYILLGVANDTLWRRFCELAGLAAIADDPRFRTNADRVANRTATVGMVQAVIGTRTSDEWMRLLGEAGIPASPINSFADVSGHPHTDATGIVLEMAHARYGTLKGVAQPIRFNGSRNAPASPPPLHGEHTAAILAGLGYTPDAVERLRADKSVFIP
ncbi:MAG: CoA transferase [Burkholderiales bacterium]|nr:CoA transferase [Burkholderiales bacterium]